MLNSDPTNKADWSNQHLLLNMWIENFFLYFNEKVRDL
jgi:hypothetical protein